MVNIRNFVVSHILVQIVFKLIRLLEFFSTYLQGKGYGSATIKQEVKLVHQVLREKPRLAIDIGGNVGEYTAELRAKNPGLEIHIFEPSSVNTKKLEVRFRSDSNVKIIPYAVSNISGVKTLFSDQYGSRLGSLAKRRLMHFNIDFICEETVNVLRFEEYWIEQLNQQKIDIVKIDIEGHELSALEGFGKAIQAVSAFQFEFGGSNIDTRTYFQDFWYFFKYKGFKIQRITPLGLEEIEYYRERDEFFSTTNYIAVKK